MSIVMRLQELFSSGENGKANVVNEPLRTESSAIVVYRRSGPNTLQDVEVVLKRQSAYGGKLGIPMMYSNYFEDSKQCALRALFEELGMLSNERELAFLKTYNTEGSSNLTRPNGELHEAKVAVYYTNAVKQIYNYDGFHSNELQWIFLGEIVKKLEEDAKKYFVPKDIPALRDLSAIFEQ